MRERPPIDPAPSHAAATAAWQARREDLADELVARFGPDDGDLLLNRIGRRWRDVHEALVDVFGHRCDAAELLDDLLSRVLDAYEERTPELRRLDRRREIDPGWFQSPEMLGYVAYVDRFAGDLAGVTEHLDHLDDLGVTYLHLMSVLEARDGDSDGGYAITDYRSTDPRLGSMDDLEHLATPVSYTHLTLPTTCRVGWWRGGPGG